MGTFKIAVIAGGPSLERGISLNSARSVLDHLAGQAVEIVPFYVDTQMRFFALSEKDLYSNTPSDFDFKLHQPLTDQECTDRLKQVDLVFPVIHGSFGEDGTLQEKLEKLFIPFIGSSSSACKKMYPKHLAKQILMENGFPTLPSIAISSYEACQTFFDEYKLQKAIVKPSCGGSSIGVSFVATPKEAFEKAMSLLQQGHQMVLLEAFCPGREFTVIVIEDSVGHPKALTPTEIEIKGDETSLFDYRKKYLPTNQSVQHTPPRFPFQGIQVQAEKIFKLFEMRDQVRLDGFYLENGTIYFTDINPISGLEQNSFFFRQAAHAGLNHHEALFCLLESACRRFSLKVPQNRSSIKQNSPIFVLFGGKGAERQVSLMSGTNVWLKLLSSPYFAPVPYLYDKDRRVWKIPYEAALNHTVEEVMSYCLKEKLLPLSLEMFLQQAKEDQAFVFIAMHGGDGENGYLQAHLEKWKIPYNGSNEKVSALCMDKYATGQAVCQLGHPDILSSPKQVVKDENTFIHLPYPLVIKPRQEGCSAGIVVLQSQEDLKRYFSLIRKGASFIPKGAFSHQQELVELAASSEYIVEPYIEVDLIAIQDHKLCHTEKQGWIELTVGVLEENGVLKALNPSISVAEGAVLSLEEKFQGGTGVNLTPPPEEVISLSAREKIKKLIEFIAKALSLRHYARIDIFFNRKTEKIIVIEVNTLPGLTPSTVFYHQGLAEDPPLKPLALLETIVQAGIER